MPLFSGGFISRAALKGEGHIHTDKWHRCIEHVKGRRGGDQYDPYAVCTHSIGYAGSINPEHQTGGRHASANPKRFKTKEGQRSARARERKARAAKDDFTAVLKWNETQHPRDTVTGKFTTKGGTTYHVETSKTGRRATLSAPGGFPAGDVTFDPEGRMVGIGLGPAHRAPEVMAGLLKEARKVIPEPAPEAPPLTELEHYIRVGEVMDELTKDTSVDWGKKLIEMDKSGELKRRMRQRPTTGPSYGEYY